MIESSYEIFINNRRHLGVSALFGFRLIVNVKGLHCTYRAPGLLTACASSRMTSSERDVRSAHSMRHLGVASNAAARLATMFFLTFCLTSG